VGFNGVAPEATGRPSYHPSGLLKATACTIGEERSALSCAARHGRHRAAIGISQRDLLIG
jgi:hypothetical protein